MMLVAKYAKVFSRTGTQPFLLTCHRGGQTEDRKFKSLHAICSPQASTPQNSAISRIAIYITAQVVGMLCLRIFLRFGKVRHFVDHSHQAIPPLKKGTEPSKKIYRWEFVSR